MSGVVRYPNYKQTGIPWLPEAPESWDVKKLHQFCSEGKTKNRGNVVSNVLSLSYGNIIRKKDIYSGLTPTDFSTYQIVEEGYVVLRLTDLQNDHKSLRCGFVRERGIITSAYVSLIPKGIFPAYLYKILHAWDLLKAFYSMGGGLRQSLKFSELSNIKILVPSFPEQRAIVAYLDDKCGKIDELVAAKEKEVELLKELKQTVIADAVTKGIDGSSPNKETGVFWQPLMPEGWSVRKLRHILKKLDRPRPDGAELLVCTNKGTVNKRGDAKIGLVSEDVSIYQGVASGDLLIHGMDTWHGAIAVSKLNGMCTTVVHVCDSTENKLFVAHYLRNMARGRLFKLLSNGVRQNTSDFRSWEKLAPLQIVLPPREEQNRIVAYIEEKTAKIDQAVAGLTQQVAALKEYKQRLIADVVTGQMRVA